MCGTTLRECKHWGPTCRKTSRRVCAECCWTCEHHISWSGIWHCSYKSEEILRAERDKKRQERFDAENMRISTAYHKQRRERARERAIREAKARKRQESKQQATKQANTGQGE